MKYLLIKSSLLIEEDGHIVVLSPEILAKGNTELSLLTTYYDYVDNLSSKGYEIVPNSFTASGSLLKAESASSGETSVIILSIVTL